MNYPLVAFCLTFWSFWLYLIAFMPMIRLKDLFLRKAMIGVASNVFPNLLLIFNVCQSLLMIHNSMLPKMELRFSLLHQFCLTELISLNCLLFRFGFEWSNDVFFYPFSSNCLTKSLECFCYSSKDEPKHFNLNAWL